MRRLSPTCPRGAYVVARGKANLATGRPRAVGDPFRIAGITKSFVATAVLQLVDVGRLRKSDKLAPWYPGFPNADRITVEDLLRMRSVDHLLPGELAGLDLDCSQLELAVDHRTQDVSGGVAEVIPTALVADRWRCWSFPRPFGFARRVGSGPGRARWRWRSRARS
jgi:CubicO group peptidase (beta-lactamase class C family)